MKRSDQSFNVWICVGLITLVCAVGTQAQDITSDLIGHWTFDEGSGTVANDSSGSGFHAEVLAGDPQWVDGVQGTALEFDGDDALHTPEWWGIEGYAGRSIMCWIKSDVIDTHGILGWGLSTGNGQKYHFRINTSESNGVVGAIRTEIQGTFNVAGTFIADNEWHHVASTFPEDGVFVLEVKHYVDGQYDNVATSNDSAESVALDTAASPDLSDQPFQIAMNIQGEEQRFYTGLIDEVRVYNRELTEEEIALIYETERIIDTSISDYMIFE